MTNLGSRLSVVSIAVLIAVLTSQCGLETDSEGTGGAGGGTDEFMCGHDVCSEVLAGRCLVAYECTEDGRCNGAEEMPNKSDGDLCTHDVCKDDEWLHVPVTPEEMDDGDPCTVDECSPVAGIVHTQKC